MDCYTFPYLKKILSSNSKAQISINKQHVTLEMEITSQNRNCSKINK